MVMVDNDNQQFVLNLNLLLTTASLEKLCFTVTAMIYLFLSLIFEL